MLSSVEETVARSQNRELVASFHVYAAWLAIAEGDNEACRERVRIGLDLIRGSEYLRLGPELCAIGLAAQASLGGDPGELLKDCREFLSGMIAWWLWGVVHVAFLAGARSRAAVSLEWLWAYLTFRRGIRLITGTEHG